ncbi:hypothetical protein GYA27_01355 [candidate division WWE3 bacterium]|uniref:Uncharacterized protein n=1 Tax=candidate division WWE3 bacterium TaxID=2053526 RepID=A0A7X9DKF9_UNCKA|nr:hypothetical protein [candidate division WWE3 bacterium]
MKNVTAVDKIIAALCMKEFKRANPKPKMRKDGTVRYNPYSLTDEINEFRELKRAYLADEISEEKYKAECLKYNLRREEIA